MSQPTQALEHASVRQYCKVVKVPVISANFARLAEQAVKENHSHIGYLEALLAMESEERDRHAIAESVARGQAATDENAGGVRVRAGTADSGSENPRTGRRRLHHAGRAGGFDRGMRNGQDALGDGAVCGCLPSEEESAVYHDSESGE